jgi:DHA2 family multidrug resistance protein-like MFS transporter
VHEADVPVDEAMTPARQGLALAVLTLPVLLISMDATILGFAVPDLSESLQPSGSQLLWIIDIYSFVVAALLVTMGNVGDRIGRRRLLMIGAAGFSAASVLAAFATSPPTLIAARALLGVAGATLLPSTLSLIHNVFVVPSRRQMAIAVWAAMFAVGAAAGPIVGGVLLEHFWWGSVFLLGVPITIALLFAAPVLVPESKDPEPGPFDARSAGLSVLTMLPVVYAIKHLAESGPSPVVVGGVLLSALAGVAFVRRQRSLAVPMIDVTLFRLPRFRAAITGNVVACFGLAGSTFFITQYLQLVVGLSPIQAGLRLLPATVGAVVMTLRAPRMARRFGAFQVSACGLAVGGSGLVLLATVDAGGSAWLATLAVLVVNGGFSPALAVAIDGIIGSVPPSKAGAGASVSETGNELGIALGTALLGSIMSVRYRAQLDGASELPATALSEARETLGAAHHAADVLGGSTGDRLRDLADSAFTDGVRVASLAAAVLAFVAAALVARAARRPAHIDQADSEPARAGLH